MSKTNRKHGLWVKIVMALVVVALLGTSLALPAPVQANVSTKWCGGLSAYTTWYGSKPILYVWKGGAGKPNPTAVSVWYNKQSVPNADNGIITAAPQVDNGSGWVGYFLSTRWYWSHLNWNDDYRWEVRGCLY